MTTYDRHQTILKLLEERSSLKVTELAGTFGVSEGTVRNDLTALAKQHLLKRVRGGAIPQSSRGPYPTSNQMQVNGQEKKRIAKWAAELVSDGDVIFLDASSTALYMVPFLSDRRNLTIITNQLEVAQMLARDVHKTVVLVGGVLRPNGASVTGLMSQAALKELQLRMAFVSCVGFSVEKGFMEADLEEATFKEQVIKSAAKVVTLLDSSKFGKVGLKAFAKLEQVDHIVTDDGVPAQTLQKLQDSKVSLTLCGEHTVQSLNPHKQETRHYKIGFANLSESIPFAVDVRRGLERAAKRHSTLDLIVADNALNGEQAVANAEQFIQQDVDLVIEYQIDETVGNLLMNRFRKKGIPVIAVDIPMVGATFFGVDNYQAGLIAGRALGTWIKNVWQGKVDTLIVLEERRAGPLPAARIQGQLEGLEQEIHSLAKIPKIVLDSGNTSERSYQQVLTALGDLSGETHLAILSFNDDAALGALKALQESGRASQAAIIGQGADRPIREEIRNGNPVIVGSTAFMPDSYGESIIDLSLKILEGKSVPPAVYSQHTFVSEANIEDF